LAEVKEPEREAVEEESEGYAPMSSEEDEESDYGEKKTIAAKCNLIISEEEVKTIIDSGAAVNIITDTLRKKLGVIISRPSNTIFTMANGGKAPSLGRAEIMIEIEDEEIPVEVQVIDSRSEDLLLGNEIFRKLKVVIDYNRKIMTIKYNYKKYEITIFFTREEERENNTSINAETYSMIENPTIYLAEMSNEEREEVKKDLKIGEVDETQRMILMELIEKYKPTIALSKIKLGKTGIVKHKINTGDNLPIAQRYYRTTPANKKIIEDEIEKMIRDGVIRKSERPWASPVVIVTKKSGNPRFCIDYRKIRSEERR